MEQTNEGYSQMLEKYREIDEDEILSGLSAQELEQLEGEIDREVLNKIPEEESEEEADYGFTSSEDEIESIPEEPEIKRRSTSRRTSRDLGKTEIKKKTSKSPHAFKVPNLKKTPRRDSLKRQSSEEGGELKKELLQAVRQRTTKRRTSRSNSSGINRRYGTHRRASSNLFKRRNSKIAKEDRSNPEVNANCITAEMLTLRPSLKKVKTREPKQLSEVLHGVCLKNVTSGAKKMADEQSQEILEDGYADSEYSDVVSADEEVANANDSLHRTLTSSKEKSCRNNDVTEATSTTAGSTSTDSYDVIGELSINPNSVEETLLRIWENDEDLVEVNLNNIQNVEMDIFEQLASAMEDNTHVKSLKLANTGLTDRAARALATMLKHNKSLETLNVESNFITGGGALRIVAALRRNNSLIELRLDNQRHIFGANVEHEFAKILKDNKTLMRFGYQFANPGPRMSASNYLTKNMDDVRKKRVAEQRMRAKAGHPDRPQLRRQKSSEWYRKEKAEKAKKYKDQGINLDPKGVIQEEDVQKVLNSMAPHEMAILEKWFTGKLMGKVEKPTKTSKRRKDTESPVATRGQLLDSIRSQSGMSNLKKVSPRPSTRSSMVDSDVEAPRSDVTKPQPSPLCDVPSRPKTPLPPIERVQLDNDVVSDDDVTNDVVHNSSNDVSETEATMYKDNQTTDDDVTNDVTHDSSNDVSEIEAAMYKDNPTSSIMDTLALPKNDDADEAMSSNTSSVDVIEWKDGESYDSDEYEVVEIEVSESEDEEEGEEESLSSDENEEKGKKTDPVSALNNLGIFSNYEKMISSPKSAAKPGKLNIEEAQESPSLSLSPGTPRPVRDDDSWIAGTAFYKIGAK